MHGSSASQTVLFLQASPPLQTQKSVHDMVCDLHRHLWVEHGVLLSHPNLITLSRSSGAKEVARGTRAEEVGQRFFYYFEVKMEVALTLGTHILHHEKYGTNDGGDP